MIRIQYPTGEGFYPEELPVDLVQEFQCLIWKYPEAGVKYGLANVSPEELIGNYLFLKGRDKEHG